MLQSLTVRNFQAHRYRKIRFDPYLTCIIGKTDRGKSALVRALRWIAENRPSGKDFVRYGRKGASATLKVDGIRITRQRGKGNHYLINDRKLSSFNKTVPKDIAQILKMSGVNFQGQFDSPFWFTESPSQVSRNLNSVVNLSLMDDVLSNLASKVRKERERVDVLGEEVSELRSRLKTLAPIKTARKDLGSIVSLGERQNRLEKEAGRLDKAISAYVSAKGRLGHPPPSLNALKAGFEAVNGIREEVEGLSRLVKQAERGQGMIAMTRTQLQSAIDSFVSKTKNRRCPTCHQVIKKSLL